MTTNVSDLIARLERATAEIHNDVVREDEYCEESCFLCSGDEWPVDKNGEWVSREAYEDGDVDLDEYWIRHKPDCPISRIESMIEELRQLQGVGS